VVRCAGRGRPPGARRAGGGARGGRVGGQHAPERSWLGGGWRPQRPRAGRKSMSELPIGYWLKHLDRLIESDFDRILAAESLNRRHWQVLHSLQEGAATVAELDARLAPFLDEQEQSVAPVVEQLRTRRWVQ